MRWLLVTILALCPMSAQAGTIHTDWSKAGPGLILKFAHTEQASGPVSIISTWSKAPPEGSGICVGRVCTRRFQKPELQRLLKNPDLSSADLPRTYMPRLDVAGVTTGANLAHEELGLDGQGVLIAIIDTGLDWTHPDFIDKQGKTRVAWLLDLSMPPQGFYPDLEYIGRGAVFSKTEIQQALDTGRGPALGAGFDTMGHGTHVAGIAAGDDEVYTGVAPGARLVIVKAIDSESGGFSQERILQALAFVLEVARLESSPLVVNLSLGNQMGAHDGSDAIELALQEMTQSICPPCAVAVAAGNEGQQSIHVRAALRHDGLPLHLGLFLGNTQQPNPSRPAQVMLDFWWKGSSLDTVISSPGGWRSDNIGPKESRWVMSSWSPGGQIKASQQETTSIYNGLHNMTITLTGEAGSALEEGLWDIELRGDASRLDGWIGEWDLGGWPGPKFTNHLDHDETIGPPATAKGVIAVGSMAHRSSWTSADGKDQNMSDIQDGQLSPFSARGPTADGRMKPELVAPGQAVASSMSSQADYRTTGSIFYSGGSLRKVMPDGIHAIASGTSMASPFVAGLCALAFENFGKNITGEQVHDMLLVSAHVDDWTGTGLFDEGWGFGKLQAMRFLEAGSTGQQAQMDSSKSLCGVSKHWLVLDPLQTITVSFIPRTSEGKNIGTHLPAQIDCDDCTFKSEIVDQGNGLYTRAIIGVGRRGQKLRPSCKLGSVSASSHPMVILAASEQEANNEGSVSGGSPGCAYSHQPIHTGNRYFLMLAILLFALSRARRPKRKNTRKS